MMMMMEMMVMFVCENSLRRSVIRVEVEIKLLYRGGHIEGPYRGGYSSKSIFNQLAVKCL